MLPGLSFLWSVLLPLSARLLSLSSPPPLPSPPRRACFPLLLPLPAPLSFAAVFSSLEGLATKMMKLSRELRSRKKKPPPSSSASASASASSADEEAGVGLGSGGGGDGGGEEEDGEGIPTEETAAAGGGGNGNDSAFPGSVVRSWWRSRYPYEGAAGFDLMREEMLIKSNAQQVRGEGRGGNGTGGGSEEGMNVEELKPGRLVMNEGGARGIG